MDLQRLERYPPFYILSPHLASLLVNLLGIETFPFAFTIREFRGMQTIPLAFTIHEWR